MVPRVPLVSGTLCQGQGIPSAWILGNPLEGASYLVAATCYLVPGAQVLPPGSLVTWDVVPAGARHLVPGTWYLVLDTQYQSTDT